jgi:hypothetical protein
LEALQLASQQALEERDARLDALQSKMREKRRQLRDELAKIQETKWYRLCQVAKFIRPQK